MAVMTLMTEGLCSMTDCGGTAVYDGRCVGHVNSGELADYVGRLGSDSTLDARGAPIDEQRCRLVAALFSGALDFTGAQFSAAADFESMQFTDRANFGGAHFTGGANFGGAYFIGGANFGGAHFTGGANFSGAYFIGGANFGGAHFTGIANFSVTYFTGLANFHRAQFTGAAAYFSGAQFGGLANFGESQFTGGLANFDRAQFTGGANFDRAQLTGGANFGGARFTGVADFAGANFSGVCLLGPLLADELKLNQAVFEGPASVHGACSTISADGVRARDTFTLTGRGCDITMIGASFGKPARIGSTPANVRFPQAAAQSEEDPPPAATAEENSPPAAEGYERARLLSVDDTDLGTITMAGLDLSACRFVGAYNLDKLHIDGPPRFAHTPAAWGRTRRRALAEEHRWRAQYDRRPAGWYSEELRQPGEDSPKADRSASKSEEARGEAVRVGAAYRELRKSFEDAKNEPGAADFYYGEMEMRRLARRGDPRHRFENALLTAYWAVSGYGLRASRALLALLLALAVGTVLFATVGFGHTQQTVYVPIRSTNANQPVAYKQTSVPEGKPGFREAAYYSVQSATSLLREPTTEPLTTVGRITEITLRLLGPLLLGLAVLALRGRVKR
jgi:uncharacterized protein YjbI with pentapeptide repeats